MEDMNMEVVNVPKKGIFGGIGEDSSLLFFFLLLVILFMGGNKY
ncbi:hypothetical protein [Tissierella creatinophila]|uniref:Uncharacterized protein n=1 Tax=Tissierella creatinophila DSM 6911 TaxID=1123403 RepID=A0A1U7M6K9_TISCR|nr:hypothetical protein [Tissierella creatinophila]OLS02964.1 hypothetical protein TICRE_10210 [Tissierella creatinophila DSM 6911]